MPNQPQLPVELYRLIVEDPSLTRQDYYNLCFTVEALRSEAHRLLYREVEIKGDEKARLLLRTLNESPNHAIHVRKLSVTVSSDPELYVLNWEKTYGPYHLVECINRMVHLQYIMLDDPWTFPAASSLMPFVEPWTFGLVLPELETLCIRGTCLKPLRTYFRLLPTPLPLFTTSSLVDLSQMDEVTEVRCDGVIKGEKKILHSLIRLEMGTLPYHHDDWNSMFHDKWAPNLQTLYFSKYLSRIRQDIHWDSIFASCFKQVKFFGPIVCGNLYPEIHSNLSQIKDLERTILVLWPDSYQAAKDEDLMRLAEGLRSLRALSFLSFKVTSQQEFEQGCLLLITTLTRTPVKEEKLSGKRDRWTIDKADKWISGPPLNGLQTYCRNYFSME